LHKKPHGTELRGASCGFLAKDVIIAVANDPETEIEVFGWVHQIRDMDERRRSENRVGCDSVSPGPFQRQLRPVPVYGEQPGYHAHRPAGKRGEHWGTMFFIYGLHIGIAGAALSTLLSRSLAAFISLGLLVRNRGAPVSLLGILKVRLVRPMIHNILNAGIPSDLESSMFQIGRLLSRRIFTSFDTWAFAANAIASVINSFFFVPDMTYGMALLTIVGQCVGAGDYEAAKKQTARIMKISYIMLVIISTLIYTFWNP
jgi:hypothetical protein